MIVEIETANIKHGEEKLEMNFDEVPEMIHTEVEVPELKERWMLDLHNAVEIDVI